MDDPFEKISKQALGKITVMGCHNITLLASTSNSSYSTMERHTLKVGARFIYGAVRLVTS